MKKLILLIAACVAIVFAANAQNPGVQGTWRVLTVDGKQLTKDYSFIKIYNATHFAWLLSDLEGNIFTAVSGTYTFNGNTLTETINMTIGEGGKKVLGKKFISKLTFEGNRVTMLGTLEGELPDTDYETWEKVE
jgi:hypothetical protein